MQNTHFRFYPADKHSRMLQINRNIALHFVNISIEMYCDIIKTNLYVLYLIGPRWASWNLGVFLCIRCAGIHRNLGVHISRVKSVNLDSWTPEQVVSLQQMGNSRARAVYEAQLPDGFRRPQTDATLESFIRGKYEHKKYVAREWVQPPPPKADWDREIDEEMEKQKRKKKGLSLGTSSTIPAPAEVKKASTTLKTSSIPAPLRKPAVIIYQSIINHWYMIIKCMYLFYSRALVVRKPVK